MPRYSVKKSIEIHADPQTVYDRVSDYGTWTIWSPWLCAEPDAKVTVTDDKSSVGSVYQWDGEVVGAGELEHKELVPGKSIRDEIRFLKPMKSVSNVTFDIEPTSDGTKLTWGMDGKLPFFLFWMTGQIESFVGMDYQRGLKMLKEWIETGSIKSNTEVHGDQQMGPFEVLGVRTTCSMDEVGESMDSSFALAAKRLEEAGLPSDGEKVTVYHNVDIKSQKFDYTSGMLFSEPVTVPSGMSSWSLPETNAFRVDHVGSYDHLGNAWSAAMQHVRYKKLKQRKGGDFELYKNDPSNTPDEHLKTEIYLPLK